MFQYHPKRDHCYGFGLLVFRKRAQMVDQLVQGFARGVEDPRIRLLARRCGRPGPYLLTGIPE